MGESMWYWFLLAFTAILMAFMDLYLRIHYYDDYVILRAMVLPVLVALLSIMLFDHWLVEEKFYTIAEVLEAFLNDNGSR